MNIEIANRLVDLRKKSGLSQEELAAKLGLSRQAVSKWERAEASPDTDNLICLAKLYGVSLDDLLNTDESVDEIVKEQVKPQEEEKKASEAEEQTKPEAHPSGEQEADSSQQEEKKTESKAENPGDSTNAKSEVHIDSNGIHFKDGSSEGSIDSSGIHVTSKDNEVHIDGTGIHVNDGVVYDRDYQSKERARAHRYHVAESIVSSSAAILATAAYLLCGFLIPDVRLGWGSCWIIFFLIPLASTFVAALKKRRFCAFAFPVLVTGIYLLLGVVYGLWHPEWVIFFSVPVYYMAFGPIDEAISRHLHEKGIFYDDDDDEDDDDDKKKKDAIDADAK